MRFVHVVIWVCFSLIVGGGWNEAWEVFVTLPFALLPIRLHLKSRIISRRSVFYSVSLLTVGSWHHSISLPQIPRLPRSWLRHTALGAEVSLFPLLLPWSESPLRYWPDNVGSRSLWLLAYARLRWKSAGFFYLERVLDLAGAADWWLSHLGVV